MQSRTNAPTAGYDFVTYKRMLVMCLNASAPDFHSAQTDILSAFPVNFLASNPRTRTHAFTINMAVHLTPISSVLTMAVPSPNDPHIRTFGGPDAVQPLPMRSHHDIHAITLILTLHRGLSISPVCFTTQPTHSCTHSLMHSHSPRQQLSLGFGWWSHESDDIDALSKMGLSWLGGGRNLALFADLPALPPNTTQPSAPTPNVTQV